LSRLHFGVATPLTLSWLWANNYSFFTLISKVARFPRNLQVFVVHVVYSKHKRLSKWCLKMFHCCSTLDLVLDLLYNLTKLCSYFIFILFYLIKYSNYTISAEIKGTVRVSDLTRLPTVSFVLFICLKSTKDQRWRFAYHIDFIACLIQVIKT
jgi:hypothetical protein